MKLMIISLLSVLFLFTTSIQQANGKSPSKTSRIVGGFDTNIKTFPFMTSITVISNNTQYYCGGALINNLWILTSGQCVFNAELFKIQLGSSTLTGDDTNRVTLSTNTFVVHPEYDPSTYANDVGLIKLRQEITFNDYIQPIQNLLNNHLPFPTGFNIVGWGQTSDDTNEQSNQLQVGAVVSSSDNTCKATYGDYYTENIICVAGMYNQGTCFGDSGSPLVYNAFDGLGYVHAGIASFLRGNGCESYDPSAYTRTEVYYNWIVNTTTTT